MAVYFKSSAPKSLLEQFDARIAQAEPKGRITTWEKSADGKYYTHKAPDWARKAWFKPVVDQGRLRFNIIRPQGANISVQVYGYYHGHLVETFLNHFDKSFDEGTSTAKPSQNDDVSA
ncbi:hypothetical protein [Luteibacter aegosomatissinici]|uniref:hypothetical protein n=1 Tax=Luteibacter aegosomatissinici TaxID=2911539 RepID=UPI001FF7D7B6|nr:hypothetical protein [Luteibacter aegosomatissinici]UPG92848.1 hypothetical protein L2Y97_13335 [Luteibacter aegosomatissinici]